MNRNCHSQGLKSMNHIVFKGEDWIDDGIQRSSRRIAEIADDPLREVEPTGGKQKKVSIIMSLQCSFLIFMKPNNIFYNFIYLFFSKVRRGFQGTWNVESIQEWRRIEEASKIQVGVGIRKTTVAEGVQRSIKSPIYGCG